jgi:hypothetical protein
LILCLQGLALALAWPAGCLAQVVEPLAIQASVAPPAPVSQDAETGQDDDQRGAESSEDYAWYQTLIPPKQASDMFGRRIARNYIVIQVTVENRHDELDLIVYDSEVVYLKKDNKTCQTAIHTSQDHILVWPCESSSQDLGILRGVAEKGQIKDPRNLILRILRAAGTAASALGAVVALGPSYAPAIAAFNGAGLTAYEEAFPDFTVNQLNRLNDNAYAANTVVKAKSSTVFVAFVPIDLYLSKADRELYWDDPHHFFHATDAETKTESTNSAHDLTKLIVLISAEHVIPRSEIQPLISGVVISSLEMANLLTASQVRGYIVGRFLGGAVPAIEDGEEQGLAIGLDPSRESTENRIYFVITPTRIPAPGELVLIQAVRGDLKTTHGERLTHRFVAPTLAAPEPALRGTVGQDVGVTLQGSGLYEGHIRFTDMEGIEVVNIKAQGKAVEATFKIRENVRPGARSIQIEVNGVRTGIVPFQVEAAPPPDNIGQDDAQDGDGNQNEVQP